MAAAQAFVFHLDIGLPPGSATNRSEHVRAHRLPDVGGEVPLERAQRRVAHAKLLLELIHRLTSDRTLHHGGVAVVVAVQICVPLPDIG
jgi:hypothetical protein